MKRILIKIILNNGDRTMKKTILFLMLVIIILPLSAVYFKTGEYATPNANSVFVSDNIAYVADGCAGLEIIDVSNPQHPVLVGAYDTPDSAQNLFVSDNIAYVADDEAGLQIIDVSNPQNSALLGDYYTPGLAESVFVSDNIAYVAYGYAGLQIIDVSHPQNPVLLSAYYTPGYAYTVFVSNNIAYVANWEGRFTDYRCFQFSESSSAGFL